MILRGLTLHRPWAAAIVHGPKRVENRSWRPSKALLAEGLTIAIHAGRKWDPDGAALVAEHWSEARSFVQAPDGSLDAKCRDECEWPEEFKAEGIVGIARVVEIADVDKIHAIGAPAYVAARPWAFGPECWVLADVRALAEPIPCRGAQGLWRLPPAVETYLRTLAS